MALYDCCRLESSEGIVASVDSTVSSACCTSRSVAKPLSRFAKSFVGLPVLDEVLPCNL